MHRGDPALIGFPIGSLGSSGRPVAVRILSCGSSIVGDVISISISICVGDDFSTSTCISSPVLPVEAVADCGASAGHDCNDIRRIRSRSSPGR